ncbi:Esterase PHB depolymerase family [Gracilaria domingensis]|nr:Esterase PHB depolymerase family [Gracilaria domingensis]
MTPTPSPGSSPSPPPPPPTPPPKWFSGRYFFFADDEPIARTLRKDAAFARAVDDSIDILEEVEYTIVHEQKDRLSSKDPHLDFGEPRICNLEDAAWGKSALDQLEVRGFPRDLSTSCITDFAFPNTTDEIRMRDTVERLAQRLYENRQAISDTAKTNFSNPDVIYDWPYVTKTEDCFVNVLGAFRIQQDWRLNIGITNERKDNYTQENRRQFLNENIGRGVRAGRMRLYVRPDDDDEDESPNHIKRNGTTMIVTHRGIAAPGVFKNIPLNENLAVIRALDRAELHSQQVNDALSPSSIAILVLPLGLNLIPIALLADVGTKATFIYAMLSDVLTVIPLSIKGIELISIGSNVFYGSVLRMSSSSNGEMPEMAAAEVYVARCSSKHNVLPTGIAFLTLSIVFMIAGLVAEIVAKRYAVRHRRRLYGRISLSSSRSSSSSAAERPRSRSSSAALIESRGAEHFAMELESYDSEYNEDHRL